MKKSYTRLNELAERHYKLILFVYAPAFLLFMVVNSAKFLFTTLEQGAAWYLIRFMNIIIVAATVIVIFALVKQLILRNEVIRRTNIALAHLDNITLDYAKLSAKVQSGLRDDELSKAAYKFLRKSTNQVSRLFSDYTGEYCHASIKVFDPANGMVSTLQRDDGAASQRDEIDTTMPDFHYRRNTAFKEVIDSADRCYYVNNDLTSTEDYENDHVNWSSEYNAVAVAPITLARAGNLIDTNSILGFICVDNKKGGFDPRFSSNVLMSIGCLYFNTLVLLVQSQKIRSAASTTPGGSV